MEKLVRSCDREYMRMAMLKHEETFKQQVYELHRLYRIQKIMMQNMEARRGVEVKEQEWYFRNAISLTQNANCSKDARGKRTRIKFDLERPAEEHIAESDDDEGIDLIDEMEIELTLGPSRYTRSKKGETPITSDSGHSLSSSSSGSSDINKIRRYMTHQKREEPSGITRNTFGIEEQLRQQERLKQSPWFFQVMNLNMT
ncbi:unnamed protein product [Vicia faba]|uniref:Uncharacterized protein n=1 Tax=Vicia faba TaxID=3906 RepID=A0AAV1AJQ7_VICFA|nr:unnamed protein product [Vicia faba]